MDRKIFNMPVPKNDRSWVLDEDYIISYRNNKLNGRMPDSDALVHKNCIDSLLKKITELENTNKNITRTLKSFEISAKEQTKTIQILNNTLERYAFSNSHKVRAPLARLLGLAKLLHINGISSDEKHDVNVRLLEAAEEMEFVISNITKLLERDVHSQQYMNRSI